MFSESNDLAVFSTKVFTLYLSRLPVRSPLLILPYSSSFIHLLLFCRFYLPQLIGWMIIKDEDWLPAALGGHGDLSNLFPPVSPTSVLSILVIHPLYSILPSL